MLKNLLTGIIVLLGGLVKSKARRDIDRLMSRLQQESCDDEVQEALFARMVESPDQMEKAVAPQATAYQPMDEMLSATVTAFTPEERGQRRVQRKSIREQKRQARKDRKNARREARKQKRAERQEAREEQLEKSNTGKRHTWQNAIKSQTVQPLQIFYPESLEAIIDIVEEATELGVKVRAVGSGHSASDVAVTSDFLVYTHGIDEPLSLDQSVLTEAARSLHLFETEAGITVRELNGELEDAGLALPNAGGSDVQTLMGAIATATHGSGLGLGSYPDLVRSLILVSTDGEVYRIEPSNGITDATKYKDPDITLVQDDDWFYSTLVSMGSMGIVYSVILELVPTYWLHESRERSTWSQVKPLLEEGSIIRENEHFEVYINPYITDGDHTCILTKRNKVRVESKPSGAAGRRNFLSGLLLSFKLTPKVIAQMFRLIPHKTPQFIDRAMRSLEDEDYVDKSYKVLNQGLKQVKTIGTAIEIGFSMDQYIPAAEKIMEIAEQRALIGCQYLTSPFALRFVKASPAYLSMMHGRDTCMIEIPTLTQSLGREDILTHFQESLYAFGGRPHWGLETDQLTGSNDLIRKMYPAYDRFMAVYRKLNHKGTFNNTFTDRVGFSAIDYFG